MRNGNYRRRSVLRSPFERTVDWGVMIGFLALVIFVVVGLDNFSAQRSQGVPTVVDGDSLVLKGTKLRLQGIDAPEYLQVCKNRKASYPCGRQARDHLHQLIANRAVDCEGWQRDKYGRLLVRCSIGLLELNQQMVASGWAVSYGDYFADETAARAAKRGVWQGDFERPSTWRKMRGDLAEVPHDVWMKISTFLKGLFGL